MAKGPNLNFRRSAAFILDQRGFDRMVDNLSPENRKSALERAMLAGALIVQKSVRNVYKAMKPDSNLDKAILVHLYPSGEGSVVRRLYVKGGAGSKYGKDTPYYRSYILNFINSGATDRYTKGKRGRYVGKRLYRGSIPATKFFQKGRNKAKNPAFKEIERILLVELAKQARK